MRPKVGAHGVGKKGNRLVAKAVEEELRWIYRGQEQDDYGIDAHIEVVKDGQATGQLIALQIKSGKSYLRKTDQGFVYYGKMQHLEYWMKHSLPVVLVLCDPDEEVCYWVQIKLDSVEKTSKKWKITVPKDQVLGKAAERVLGTIAKNLLRYQGMSLQGNPPAWAISPQGLHFWYYENQYGEQWVAKRAGDELWISGLDIGWQEIRLTVEQAEAEQRRIRELRMARDLSKMPDYEDFNKLHTQLFFRKYDPEMYPIAQRILNEGELLWIASVMDAALMSMRWVREDKSK